MATRSDTKKFSACKIYFKINILIRKIMSKLLGPCLCSIPDSHCMTWSGKNGSGACGSLDILVFACQESFQQYYISEATLPKALSLTLLIKKIKLITNC
jgi:hypothetical protein